MVAVRSEPRVTEDELVHGIPLVLDQLIKTLRIEQTSQPLQSRTVSGLPGGGAPSEISATAVLHGRELLARGFTLEQVVRDYGNLCQAITSLAFELGAPIEVDEFRTFNRCLDNAIAGAVTEYSLKQRSAAAEDGVQALNARLGPLAHELRNLVHTATLSVQAIKAGNVGLTGATGAVLDRCLIGLRLLIDRSLAEVRVTAGLPPQRQLFFVDEFIAEAAVAASLEARARECTFVVSAHDTGLAIHADRDMMFSALGNLLHNAFKFTRRGTEVTLRTYAVADRVLFEVEDHCGGLPPGGAESMFLPFKKRRGQVRTRPGSRDLQAQRRGERRCAARPGYTRQRMRFYHRPSEALALTSS